MRKYLRRCFALLCALLMLSDIQWAGAAETVYFTAVNETVLELSDATMPFWSGKYLYVASSMFSNKELGVSYSNNTVTRIVTLYNSRGALLFDLNNGTAVDGRGNTMPLPAIVRNGRVFLPVDMVAEFFDLSYTQNAVSRGNVVRLRSEDSVLNDRLFLDAAASLLEYRYDQYEKAKAEEEEPVVDPPVTQDPPKPPEPPSSDERTVYLCLRVSENTGTLLDVLDDKGTVGTFFFTEEQLAGNADLARRMVVTGHAVGLTADAAQETEAAEQLRSANALLWRLTGCKTRLCVLENGTAADREAVREAGYCCLRADVDRSVKGLTESSAGVLYRAVHNSANDAVTVWLSDNVSARGLREFLTEAEDAGDGMPALTETVLNP